jgi:hypothetical protein
MIKSFHLFFTGVRRIRKGFQVERLREALQDDEAGEGGHGQGPERGTGEVEAAIQRTQRCSPAAKTGHVRIHRSN